MRLVDRNAKRRAIDGVEEPVYYRGQKVGTKKWYSDTLLMFLLKKLRPEYREAHKKTHDGTVNVTFRWRNENDGWAREEELD